MSVLDGGGDRRREGAALDVNLGRPIVTNGALLHSLLWESDALNEMTIRNYKIAGSGSVSACRWPRQPRTVLLCADFHFLLHYVITIYQRYTVAVRQTDRRYAVYIMSRYVACRAKTFNSGQMR